jgi:hypothetical protein
MTFSLFSDPNSELEYRDEYIVVYTNAFAVSDPCSNYRSYMLRYIQNRNNTTLYCVHDA